MLSALVKQKAYAELQQELLIGFDPIQKFSAELQGRFGHLAEFCVGGTFERFIAVKWRATAFFPGQHRIPSAHTQMPRVFDESSQALSVLTDASSVIHEIMEIGAGLLADIIVPSDGHLL